MHYIRFEEAVQRLRLTRSAVARMVDRGTLRGTPSGMVVGEDVERFLAAERTSEAALDAAHAIVGASPP